MEPYLLVGYTVSA